MDNKIDNLGQPDEPQESQPEETSSPQPEEIPAFGPDQTADTQAAPEPQQETEPEQPGIPEGPSKDEKLWATFCHLAAFVGYIGIPLGSVLGPLIIWLIKKEGSSFINENGRKAVNFNISILIYMLASLPLACAGPLVLLAIIPLAIVGVIFPIVAALKANNGEEVKYPISIEFIK